MAVHFQTIAFAGCKLIRNNKRSSATQRFIVILITLARSQFFTFIIVDRCSPNFRQKICLSNYKNDSLSMIFAICERSTACLTWNQWFPTGVPRHTRCWEMLGNTAITFVHIKILWAKKLLVWCKHYQCMLCRSFLISNLCQNQNLFCCLDFVRVS